MRDFYLLLLLLFLSACRDNSEITEPPIENPQTPSIVIMESESNTTNLSCINNFETFFNAELNGCVACHKEGGVAINANAQFLLFDNDPYANYASMKSYLEHSSALFLSKPTGLNHQGGTFITLDSAEYQSFEIWMQKINDETCIKSENSILESSYYQGTTLLSLEATYKKASLLLRGTLPNVNEVDLVNMMQGKGFDAFLMTSANDQLLVKKYLNENTQATEILDSYHYPELTKRFELSIIKDTAASVAYNEALIQNAPADELETKRLLAEVAGAELDTSFSETQDALVYEPLRLIVDIVSNNRPYGEILTADYMMLNPYSAGSYGSTLSFSDMDDVEDYKKGKINKYNFYYLDNDTPVGLDSKTYDALPVAGLLTSPIFLARYPSTATNRNRARSRAVYKLFLGFDIESLAIRSMDPEELKKATNPSDSNSSCYACHIVMDPVAGAFYNWGDNGHFKERA